MRRDQETAVMAGDGDHTCIENRRTGEPVATIADADQALARQARSVSKPVKLTPADKSAKAGSATTSNAKAKKKPPRSENASLDAGEANDCAQPNGLSPRQNNTSGHQGNASQHCNAADVAGHNSLEAHYWRAGDTLSDAHPMPENQAKDGVEPASQAPYENRTRSAGGTLSDAHRDGEARTQTGVSPANQSTSGNDRHLVGGDQIDGRTWTKNQDSEAVPGDGDHICFDNHYPCEAIAPLVQLTRMRRRWHKAEKSLTLQGKALARSWCAGDKDEANKLFALAEKSELDDPTLSMALMPFLQAREPFATERAIIEKQMRKLARSLPVWQWAEGVKGLGDLRLAIIVGECGDLGSYKTVSAVWKRMGLAVIDGGRQRRVAGEAALDHGYNPERRAVAYVLGTEIIKAQIRNVRDEDGKRTDESAAIGPYGQVYLDHKAIQLEREDVTKAHANNRAARYMVKRVLRDLYAAWRAAS